MTTADIIKNIVLSYQKKDDDSFFKVVKDYIEKEKLKKNNSVAKELENILYNDKYKPDSRRKFKETIPRDTEKGFQLLEIKEYDYIFDDIIIDANTKEHLKQIIDEFKYSDVFATYNLQHKNKILLCGKPGTGKTYSAQIVSSVLNILLVYIRFDAIISSYLGETANNLKKVFDFIKKNNPFSTDNSLEADPANWLNAFVVYGSSAILGVIPILFASVVAIPAYELKGKHIALADELEWIMKDIIREYGNDSKEALGIFSQYLETLKDQSPFKYQPNLKKVLDTAQHIANYYYKGASLSVRDVYLSAYEWWLIWYVPILPFLTGWWTTSKRGPMKAYSYEYYMSIPINFRLSNIVSTVNQKIEGVETLKAPDDIDTTLEIVPDKLKPNAGKWLAVNDWLTQNKLYDYDVNTNHKTFKHLTQENVESIYYSFVDSVYDVYEGNTPVYVDKSKPYTEVTNIIISSIITNILDGVLPTINYTTNYVTNVTYNIIDNPTILQRDEQNKFNINNLKDIINEDYDINLVTY